MFPCRGSTAKRVTDGARPGRFVEVRRVDWLAIPMAAETAQQREHAKIGTNGKDALPSRGERTGVRYCDLLQVKV